MPKQISKKGKPDKPPPTEPPPEEIIEPEPEPEPIGDPVSGTFKGIVTPTGGEPKEVEGDYSGTSDPETGEFNVMGILFSSSGGGVGVTTLVRRGTTLTFSEPVEVMQNFLDYDFIKVPAGGVGVTISPAPTGTGITRRNGAMVNPNNFWKQGFDGRIFESGTYLSGLCYDQTTSFVNGSTVHAGDSMITSISLDPEVDYAGLIAINSNAQAIGTVEFFTFVSTLPSVNTFRPPMCGTSKPMIARSAVNYGLLPGLTPPCDPKNASYGTNKWSDTDPKQCMNRPWLDRSGCLSNAANPVGISTEQSGLAPRDYQDWYPVGRGAYTNRLAVYSMCNFADVQTVADRIIQYGIDMKGVTEQSNWSWRHYGAGFGIGRTLPLLYAGWLLGDSAYTSIVSGGSAASPRFSEQRSFYHSATPYSGYVSGVGGVGGYPVSASWAAAGPWPMFGEDYPGPYGTNHTLRDPAGKYNAVGGVNSAGVGASSGNRYQACDAGGTGNQTMTNAGGYLTQPAGIGRCLAGMYIWSTLAGQNGNWGSQAAIDFAEWWCADRALASPPARDIANTYFLETDQYGGVGGNTHQFMKEMYENHVA